MEHISQSLLTNASVDETVSEWVDVRGYSSLVFYLSSTGTTSSGAVSLEEMFPGGYSASTGQAYTGPSSLIVPAINASTFSGTDMTAQHMPLGAYGFVRARVSTAIGGGGSVSVGLVANK